MGRPPWRPGRAGMTDSEAGPGQGLGERWTGLGFGGWDGDPHALLFWLDQPWVGGGAVAPSLSSFLTSLESRGPASWCPRGSIREHTLEVSGRHLGEISFNLTPNNNFSAFLIASSCAGPPAGSHGPRLPARSRLRREAQGRGPSACGVKNQFHGRPFLHGPRMGGWRRDDPFALHLLCPLLLLLHQLLLRSSGIRSQGLGTPAPGHRGR